MLFTPKQYPSTKEINAACISGDAHSDTQLLSADGVYVDVFGYVDGVAYEAIEMSNHFDIDMLCDPEYSELIEYWVVCGDPIDPAPAQAPRAWIDNGKFDRRFVW